MEIAISRDIRKYKTKDVGNFSFKEAGVKELKGERMASVCLHLIRL